MTGACCQDTWGLRGLSAGPRRQSWPEGGEGLAKEDMASLESRDQSKGYTQPTSDRIHLKGFEGTLDGVTRYPQKAPDKYTTHYSQGSAQGGRQGVGTAERQHGRG